jgi:hypothetical protein
MSCEIFLFAEKKGDLLSRFAASWLLRMASVDGVASQAHALLSLVLL